MVYTSSLFCYFSSNQLRILGECETYTPSSVGPPVGGVQAFEGWDKINVSSTTNGQGQSFAVFGGVVEDSHVVLQPVQCGSGHGDAAYFAKKFDQL